MGPKCVHIIKSVVVWLYKYLQKNDVFKTVPMPFKLDLQCHQKCDKLHYYEILSKWRRWKIFTKLTSEDRSPYQLAFIRYKNVNILSPGIPGDDDSKRPSRAQQQSLNAECILSKEQLYDMFQQILGVKKFEHQLLFNALLVSVTRQMLLIYTNTTEHQQSKLISYILSVTMLRYFSVKTQYYLL